MFLILGLSVVVIYLLAFGIAYAIYIYKWPWKRTYSEVGLGVAATIAGEMVALGMVLVYYGLFYQLWWIIPFPLIAFILTGVPMMILQEIKTRKQGRKAEKLNSKYNGD